MAERIREVLTYVERIELMSDRIPEQFVELWMSFSLSTDPEPMYCSLGIRMVTPYPGPNQTDTDAFLAPMQTRLKTWCTTEYNVGPGHAIWGTSSGDVRVDGSAATAAGTLTAGALPQNCATLVKKGTAFGGRRNQGRMYVPGIPEANVANNGAIAASPRATLQTSADGLLTDLNAVTKIDDVVLFHNSAPWTPTSISTLTVLQVIGTQRRRMRR